MLRFAIATLGPVVLLALALRGGPWPLIALLAQTLGLAIADRIAPRLPSEPGTEFPASRPLLIALALAQPLVIALALQGVTGDALGPADKLLLLLAAGLWLGQVGSAAGHELIHRPERGLRRLGAFAFALVLYGHHASAHGLVHHVHVATPLDPATARAGEGLYRYLPRAWIGAWRAGLRAETARLRRAGRPLWRHPYLAQGAVSLAALATMALTFGPGALPWYLGLALIAQVQLLASDYVQHYGLTRALRPDGRPEPVGPAHSWNSPAAASAALLLNGPLHSHHHVQPMVEWPRLRLPPEAPVLPYSLPVMASLAFVPPVWRRVMRGPLKRLAPLQSNEP